MHPDPPGTLLFKLGPRNVKDKIQGQRGRSWNDETTQGPNESQSAATASRQWNILKMPGSPVADDCIYSLETMEGTKDYAFWNILEQ